jgi:hypothetical protein
MKRMMSIGLLAMVAVVAANAADEAMPEPDPAGPEHAWLQQLTGTWSSVGTIHMEGQPPLESKGTEEIRAVGDYWIQSTQRGEMMGESFTGILTLGFDAPSGAYVGTWVDSMTGHLWRYTGSVNDAGDTLTLETSGPCPMGEGKDLHFREVLKIKDENHKTFTSHVKGPGGEWSEVMSVVYTRN